MELTPDQAALRDAVRTLLARHPRAAAPDHSPPRSPGPGAAFPAPYDAGLWARLAGIGAAGLAVPEKYGGAGAGPVETHVVAEELGRHLTPSPLLGSAVLAAQALLAAGDDDACRRLLPAIAGGTSVAALAWTGPDGHWDPDRLAVTADSGWLLDGEAHYVLDGDVADVLLVAAATPDGPAVFEVDPGAAGVSAVATMDTARRLATVTLAGAPGRRIGRPGPAALARARDLACIALSAEQVGAAQQALDLTVDYLKVRIQFGRPIGGFQALQHRVADLHVLVTSARSLSYAAAQAAADQAPDLALHAAAAKVYCTETLQQVAAQTIQLHGAIGITWEHPAHRYLKRAHASAHLFGHPTEHAARIATAILGPCSPPDRRAPPIVVNPGRGDSPD